MKRRKKCVVCSRNLLPGCRSDKHRGCLRRESATRVERDRGRGFSPKWTPPAQAIPIRTLSDGDATEADWKRWFDTGALNGEF
jgi:hypothetical protein